MFSSPPSTMGISDRLSAALIDKDDPDQHLIRSNHTVSRVYTGHQCAEQLTQY